MFIFLNRASRRRAQLSLGRGAGARSVGGGEDGGAPPRDYRRSVPPYFIVVVLVICLFFILHRAFRARVSATVATKFLAAAVATARELRGRRRRSRTWGTNVGALAGEAPTVAYAGDDRRRSFGGGADGRVHGGRPSALLRGRRRRLRTRGTTVGALAGEAPTATVAYAGDERRRSFG